MPVIFDANGKMGFWFDTNKPRKTQEWKQAEKRWRTSQDPEVRKKKRKREYDSIHHIAGRDNGAAYNLFVCESSEQHNNLHNQLQEFHEIAVKSGLIQFDFDTKKYIVANPYLIQWLNDWIKEGEPNRHDPNYRPAHSLPLTNGESGRR